MKLSSFRAHMKALPQSKKRLLLILLTALLICVFAFWKRSRKSGTPANSAKSALASLSPTTILEAEGEGHAPAPEHLMLPPQLGSYEPPNPPKMAHELQMLDIRVGALEQCKATKH